VEIGAFGSQCRIHDVWWFGYDRKYRQQVSSQYPYRSCAYDSYSNVLATRKKAGKPLLTPLLGYLPFLLHSAILVFWLQSELRGGNQLVHDARLLPFLGYWAMAYVPL
jgi:hypothetical protein